MRQADIEATNRCNALCHFCPRDRMPKLGIMQRPTFEKALERLVAHPDSLSVSFCGFGEPLLNPDLAYFVRRTRAEGLHTTLTTNASLLDREQTEALLDAGLNSIVFSISDLGEDYEEVYNLDYERTAANIDNFLAENERRGRPCFTYVSVVRHDINYDKVHEYRRYWKGKGVNRVILFAENNRGGSLERGHLFQGNEQYVGRAQEILEESGASALCQIPFESILVSWEGFYLLCCQEWEKRMPLGHINEHSVSQVDQVKYRTVAAGNPICRDCDLNPVNAVRERLMEMDDGTSGQGELDALLERFRENSGYESLALVGPSD